MYKNAGPDLKKFFTNFSSKDTQKEKEKGALSFSLLMSNFRRKKIIETLKSRGNMSQAQRLQVLQPYQAFVQSQLQLQGGVDIHQDYNEASLCKDLESSLLGALQKGSSQAQTFSQENTGNTYADIRETDEDLDALYADIEDERDE